MESHDTEVVTKEQHEEIKRIKAYHEGFKTAFGSQMGYAYLGGRELNAVKARLGHGRFMDWREKFLPEIPHRTATRYMKFQEALVDMATGGQFAAGRELLQLSGGELNEESRRKVLDLVHEFADGKTLTELYRDLGMIREAKPHEFHAAKLSPEQKVRADQAAAEQFVEDVLTGVRRLLDDLQRPNGMLASRIGKPKWRETSALLVATTKQIRPLGWGGRSRV